jgi:lipopolysaccharide export system protein LptA
MRGFSRLLAFLFLALLLGTGAVYYFQRQFAEANATRPPAPLAENIAGTADRWQWSRTIDGKPIVEVSAREYRMIQSPSRIELEDVELKIYGGSTETYDLVKSRRADVDTQAKTMYSEGEVEITMQVSAKGDPLPERPMVIRSSKVYFETETGIARSSERTYFQFADGFGESLGAIYNPQTKEVVLGAQATFTFKNPNSKGVATKVSASHAVYREVEGTVSLNAPSRMVRNKLVIDAADSQIFLNKGEIERIEAFAMSGKDEYTERRLEFGGDHVEMFYRPDGSLREIISHSGSRLDSINATSHSSARSHSMNLLFREGDDAILEKAFARGNAKLESKPIGKEAERSPQRILTSEELELKMRPNGSEVDQLLTHAPGVLTFIPATLQQRHRTLHGDRITVEYGDKNHLKSFRATKVTTESQPSAEAIALAKKEKRPVPPPLRTRSQDMESSFHPESGELTWIRQWGNFEFDEGPRRGRADSALMHQAEKYNLLEGNARIWDDSGSLQARTIRTVEPSGDMVAEGDVISTRKSDKKASPTEKASNTESADQNSTLLGGGDSMQATAAKMTTRNQNKWIRYEGNARLWQGANRLHAEVAIIDREKQTLEGSGKVFSQIEEAKSVDGKRRSAPLYTLIHAAKLLYKETENLATYTGNVKMRREGLSVDSDSQRMLLAEDSAGQTQLKQSFADGNVRILMKEPDTVRRGGAEHAEYYPEETKMVLYGGDPFFEDQKEGATRGARLTYFSNEDRLIVEGGGKPAVSVIRRK